MLQGEIFSVVGATHDHQAGTVVSMWCDTPIRVVRWGLIVEAEAVVPGSGAAALHGVTHVAAGTPTAAAIGTATMDIPAGNIGTVMYVEPTTDADVKAGDIVLVSLTTGFTSGDVVGFIQYQKLNWNEQTPVADYEDTIGDRVIDATT